MNQKQYFAISLFFLVLLFMLPVIIMMTSSIHHDSAYFGARDGILSALIYISFPLMILFSVLGSLEHKRR